MKYTELETINIQKIALQIRSIDNFKNRLVDGQWTITSKDLASKIKSLDVLEETPLIKYLVLDDDVKCIIPTIYKTNDDEIVLVNVDNSRTINKNFELVEWAGGIANYAVVSNGLIKLKVGISFTSKSLEDFQSELNNQVTSKKYDLNPYWLNIRPQIEIPLRSLKPHVEYEISNSNVGYTKQYRSLMVDLKDNQGNLINNVIANTQLKKLIDADCKSFEIYKIVQEEQEYIDDETKKSKTRTTSKVFIKPVESTDFSDF